MSFLGPFLARCFSRPISLNRHLIRLIVGGLAPLLIFSIVMMVLFARQEQANRRRGLEDTARALALAVDLEIKASLTNLEALATADPLDFGLVDSFREIVVRIFRTQKSWKSIMLFDTSGRRLFSITKPQGADPGNISPENLTEVLRTRRPVISDYSADDYHERGINIHVPVRRENKIVYVITAAIEPQIFTDILLRQQIPSEWRGTLFDARQITIATTRDGAKYVGQLIGPLLRQTRLEQRDQLLSGTTDDGMRVYAAIAGSQLSRWHVAVVAPSAEVDAIVGRSIGVVVAGALLLLLGVGVALIFARQVSRSIRELSSAAHALGRGELISSPNLSPIAELETLGRAMSRAAELLREREQERDRVENALREQEEFLQRQADLLNLANEAIFAWDLHGRIVFWNRGAEQLYGYSQQDAIGCASQELLSTEYPETQESFDLSLASRGEWAGELTHKTKDGRRIIVESRFKLISDRAGGRVVLECTRDITSRKRTAQRLMIEQAVTRILAESQTMAEACGDLLQTIGEGMGWDLAIFWTLDRNRQALSCLETWHRPATRFAKFIEQSCNLVLARGKDLPGRVWANKESLWVSDIATASDSSRSQCAADEGLHGAFAFPIMLREEILAVAEFVSDKVREEDTELLKIVQTIGSEISQFIERVRAEEALRRSEERLRNQAQELEQQLMASGRLVAVGELTASMAHEFNNPLGIILGFAQGLLSGMDPSEENYRHVQIIAEEAKRCEKLVQEVLEFGRPKSADFALTRIDEIIHKTIDLVKGHAAKNHVETVTTIEEDLPRLYVDAQQVQQVILNLCLNAVDAMPTGGKLTVGAARDSTDRITITVSDTGYGIDAETARKIFQPFFTAKKRRGLGLGLSICDRIVKAHGGRITVNSKPGEGTTFAVLLPLDSNPATKQRTETTTAETQSIDR
jgi:PAS domain S-box-containing protein